MRVLAAMSGGVDSAVAAALAVEAGHDVVGVHLALAAGTGPGGCCTTEDALDAQRAADVLGIGCHVWDLSAQFAEIVVADFLDGYAAGRTPNPCVRCNDHVKFGLLLDRAREQGFDAVCTGHYARVDVGEGLGEEVVLRRATYGPKDQSYVLAVAGPDRLARTMFPLGEMASKDQVRALAAARGLPMATKGDSLDLCFVPDGDLRGFLRRRLGSASGEIVETDGTVVGHHDGTYGYTIGQRRGLALGRPAPDGKPRFVLEVCPKENEVIVGSRELLAVDEIRGIRATWAGVPVDQAARFLQEPEQSGARSEEFEVTAQVRAHADPVRAKAYLTWAPDPEAEEENALRLETVVRLLDPLSGVAPGQTMVLYQGTRVLGQSTIARAYSLNREDIQEALGA